MSQMAPKKKSGIKIQHHTGPNPYGLCSVISLMWILNDCTALESGESEQEFWTRRSLKAQKMIVQCGTNQGRVMAKKIGCSTESISIIRMPIEAVRWIVAQGGKGKHDFLISSPSHTCAVHYEDTQYYFFDPNSRSITGVPGTTQLSEVEFLALLSEWRKINEITAVTR